MTRLFRHQKLGRKVGFRYLMAKKSSSFLSLITAISVSGVGVGVLTMVVTLSVMSGFESEMKKRLFQAETHVLVEANTGYFKTESDLLTKIRNVSPSIEKVYPVLQTEVILRSGKKVTGSVLKGVQTEQLEWLKSQVVEWVSKDISEPHEGSRLPALFVGSEMAFDLGVVPGDTVTIVSPVESEGPLGTIPRMKRFIIEGVYKTGVPEQEMHVVFAPIKEVESFLQQEGVLSQIEVKVHDLEDAPVVAQELEKKLQNDSEASKSFSARPWQVLNAHLFQSLQLERAAMFCILIFIVIVASFNIISTLTMMVLEKKRSLSILRAMGATKKQIASIFLWEGCAIGVVGIGGGTALGLLVCYGLAKYPVVELPDYFYDRTLPVLVQPVSIAIVSISAMMIVLLGALKPARKASELIPIHGIKEN